MVEVNHANTSRSVFAERLGKHHQVYARLQSGETLAALIFLRLHLAAPRTPPERQQLGCGRSFGVGEGASLIGAPQPGHAMLRRETIIRGAMNPRWLLAAALRRLHLSRGLDRSRHAEHVR
jgi:hypothetical protein